MLKQTLLAFSVLSITGAAAAKDITNPFYLISEQGELDFVTSGAVKRSIEKNDLGYHHKSIQMVANEEIRFGLTDSLALLGSIGNTWDRWKGNWKPSSDKTIKDNENIAWTAGLGWNILSGPARWQISSVYGQDRLRSFDGEYKYIAAETKLGYQFKTFLPYVTGGIEIPIGQKAGQSGLEGNKLIYNTKVGVYQGKCEVWALDTGVRLTYDENRESRVVSAEAEASYYITPNVSVGVYGTYALDGRAKYDVDLYEKSAGVRLRLAF